MTPVFLLPVWMLNASCDDKTVFINVFGRSHGIRSVLGLPQESLIIKSSISQNLLRKHHKHRFTHKHERQSARTERTHRTYLQFHHVESKVIWLGSIQAYVQYNTNTLRLLIIENQCVELEPQFHVWLFFVIKELHWSVHRYNCLSCLSISLSRLKSSRKELSECKKTTDKWINLENDQNRWDEKNRPGKTTTQDLTNVDWGSFKVPTETLLDLWSRISVMAILNKLNWVFLLWYWKHKTCCFLWTCYRKTFWGKKFI